MWGNVVEFDVVVDQLAPNQVGENQPVDNAPDKVDTVEEVGVPCAQNNPAVVENGRQEEAHQEDEGGEEKVLAVGHDGVLENREKRQGKGEVADRRV